MRVCASQIAGTPDIDLSEHIDRKQWRFMGDAAGYAYLSLQQAIAHAGLSDAQVSNPRTGIVAGSGGASSANQVEAADILRDRGIRRVGPYRVTQTMGSTVLCLSSDTVSDQGRQLFNLLRLLNQRTLYRSRDGADSAGQARRGVLPAEARSCTGL